MSTSLFHRELRAGSGSPVILSHALGLDHEMWLPIIDKMDTKRPILAFDHCGHGSSFLTNTCSMDDLVKDAALLIETVSKDNTPVMWLGLSLGAMVGQGLAIQRPELIDGLLLAHTAARYTLAAKSAWAQRVATVRAQGMAAVVDIIVERYLCDNYRSQNPLAVSKLKHKLLGNDPASYAACCEAVANVDWIDALNRVKTPTLILGGAYDKGATPEMADEIHQRIASSQLTILPEVSHLSPWEDSEAFALITNKFISTLTI